MKIENNAKKDTIQELHDEKSPKQTNKRNQYYLTWLF